MQILKCTKCGQRLNGFIPEKCGCGFTVPVINSVYQFTNDKPISVDGDGLKWLGYENVGENYELGNILTRDDGDFGMFGACSRKLAEILGKDKIALDLGAGLGPAAIPLAIAGVNTIAADISQTMMEVCAKRAAKNNTPDNKIICTRMNAYKLEIADNSLDAVIEIDMLHQVDRPELVIEEIRRILKHGGVFAKYSSQTCGYTPEQEAANAHYNKILQDIKDFYAKIISEAEFDRTQADSPFSSWDSARNSIKESFQEPQIFETNEIQFMNNWDMNAGLYKTKTRASGGTQLIPDEIHNDAWTKTEEYAENKYGVNYSDIKRYYNFIGVLQIYRFKN